MGREAGGVGGGAREPSPSCVFRVPVRRLKASHSASRWAQRGGAHRTSRASYHRMPMRIREPPPLLRRAPAPAARAGNWGGGGGARARRSGAARQRAAAAAAEGGVERLRRAQVDRRRVEQRRARDQQRNVLLRVHGSSAESGSLRPDRAWAAARLTAALVGYGEEIERRLSCLFLFLGTMVSDWQPVCVIITAM